MTILPASAVRAYRALYTEHGLRLTLTGDYPAYNWDATGRVRIPYDPKHIDMVSHEIAHFLVATPSERRQHEYGLGDSPIARVYSCKTTRRHTDDVEALASVLGIWIAVRVEGRQAVQYADWHNWDRPSFRLFTKKLLAQRFLVWSGGRIMPRCLVKAPKERDIWRTP